MAWLPWVLMVTCTYLVYLPPPVFSNQIKVILAIGVEVIIPICGESLYRKITIAPALVFVNFSLEIVEPMNRI